MERTGRRRQTGLEQTGLQRWDRGIVVGWDDSPGSRIALDWAAEVARRHDTRLTLVHCVEPSMSPGLSAFDTRGAGSPVRDGVSVRLQLGLERAATVLGPENVTGHDVFGTPPGQLVAASEDADLVVTGSRGRARVLAGLLGSTAYAVVAHAHCPVAVVRVDAPGAEEPVHPGPDRRVVVGIDGSEASSRAIRAAADVAGVAGARLHVVAVASAGPTEPKYYKELPSGGRHDREVQAHVQDWLQEARAILSVSRPGLDIEYETLYGDPGHTLADLSIRAGLVVVGSRGRGGFTGLLLGSVSHTVIHEAHCPVMVVH